MNLKQFTKHAKQSYSIWCKSHQIYKRILIYNHEMFLISDSTLQRKRSIFHLVELFGKRQLCVNHASTLELNLGLTFCGQIVIKHISLNFFYYRI